MQDVNFYPTDPPARRIVPERSRDRQRAMPASAPRPTVVAAPSAEPDSDLTTVIGHDDPRLAQVMTLMARYFKISPEVYERDGHCQHAVMSATALCLTYGFSPSRHVYVRRIVGEWVYETGYRAWLDSANQMAKQGRFRFDVECFAMTDNEVRESLGANYSAGDRGYFARVLEDRAVLMYEKMGRVYDPEFSAGFWRKRAFLERDASDKPTGEWLPDPIYTGRDAAYTAELRARKAALMKVYSLVEINNYSAERRLQILLLDLKAELEERGMKEQDRRDQRFSALPANARRPTADDPDMIWAQ